LEKNLPRFSLKLSLLMKFEKMALHFDNAAQIDMILDAVKNAAYGPQWANSSYIHIFGADKSEMRELFENLNVAIDPNYLPKSYEKAFDDLPPEG
jgi:hypothetical protein